MPSEQKRAAEAVSTPTTNKRTKSDSVDDLILAKMMENHYKVGSLSVPFGKLERECGYRPRNNNFRIAFNGHKEEGNVISSDGKNYQLSEKGVELAGGTVDVMKKAKTNQEHQDRIKSKLKKKGPEIFDLLLDRPLQTRKELASTLGVGDGTHYFSYALKELKDLGYVVVDAKNSKKGKKLLLLSERSFLNSSDFEAYENMQRANNEVTTETQKKSKSESKEPIDNEVGGSQPEKNKAETEVKVVNVESSVEINVKNKD